LKANYKKILILKAGKSACGKKEAKPCGILARTEAQEASRRMALEGGTTGSASEPPRRGWQ